MALIVWRETPSAAARAPWDRPAAVRRLRTSLFMVTSILVTMKSVKSTCPKPDRPSVRPSRVEKPWTFCQTASARSIARSVTGHRSSYGTGGRGLAERPRFLHTARPHGGPVRFWTSRLDTLHGDKYTCHHEERGA